jgi:hypothetical protein
VRADGSTCDDGNGCTQTDLCQAGSCLGSNPVTCTASDACHLAGTCDPATGTCSNPSQPDGTSCDDGTACTRQDACQAGVCVGSDPVTCSSDQCNIAGLCNPTTGVCDSWFRDDGTVCDDGNACTQGDSCWGGHCMSGAEVRCSSPNECQAPTACDPTTGACSLVQMPDGTPCNDQNACTQGEACWGDECKMGGPISCDDVDACTTDECDPATGCSHTRIGGLAGISCHCDNGLNTMWCPSGVPGLIQKPFAKACKILGRAHGASAKKQRKLMLKARKVFKKARKAAMRAKKKQMITADCAMDVFTVMDDSTSRVKMLTTNVIRP